MPAGLRLSQESNRFTGVGWRSAPLANNLNDNRIYVEAFSNDLAGPASELLLTGAYGGSAPQISLVADQTNVMGTLHMNGNSIVNCGALTEANLQTPEETPGRPERPLRRRGRAVLGRWPPGIARRRTIGWCKLWQTRAGDPSSVPEVVKVIGPVHAGDYLVSSSVPGYAMVSPAPVFGIVIAQALERLQRRAGADQGDDPQDVD